MTSGRAVLIATLLAVAGCAVGPKPAATRDLIDSELQRGIDNRQPAAASSDALFQALLPPVVLDVPAAKAIEPRFDLSVNAAPASQVFMAIVSGTRYSAVVHPDVSGTVSVSLKDVTVREALDTLREMYGYEYTVQGTRIMVQPVSLQSRLFQVNYLTSRRIGSSGTRVSSGPVNAASAAASGATGGAAGAGQSSGASSGTQVSTDNDNDFWQDLKTTIRTLIACADGRDSSGRVTYGACPEGRSVVASPQSGIIVVRAMPRELREVEQYLRAARVAVERQVMIEAKIIEVVLNDGFQSGINWAALTRGGGHRMSNNALTDNFKFPGGKPAISDSTAAVNSANAAIAANTNAALAAGANAANAASAANAAAANAASIASANAANQFNLANRAPGDSVTYTAPTFTSPTFELPTYTPDVVPLTASNTLTGAAGILAPLGGLASGGVLGLAFQTGSFSMLMSFLETQGTVHVLSSPRIATLNNQKAVLKVGTDDIFVSNFTPGTPASQFQAATPPVPTLTPYFSGISLDVTPQIDGEGNIMLHVRPMVSVVTERTKVINFGTQGSFTVPLASNSVNETDSIVRVRNGNIVAIGGLMEQSQTEDTAKVPGAGDVPVVGHLFKQGKKSMQKREFVVLLKPTIIDGDREWSQDLQQTRERIQAMQPAPVGAAAKP